MVEEMLINADFCFLPRKTKAQALCRRAAIASVQCPNNTGCRKQCERHGFRQGITVVVW
jgi:hypothetical protein